MPDCFSIICLRRFSPIRTRCISIAIFTSILSITANATPVAPTDFFVDAATSGPFYSNDTGAIAGPVAQSTDPITAVYYSPTLRQFNTDPSGILAVTGGATAEADITSYSLHAAAGATSVDNGFGGFAASASAMLGDTLYFTNSNASASTITTVNFTAHIDGTVFDSEDFSVAFGPNEIGVPNIGFNPASVRCSATITTNCVFNGAVVQSNNTFGAANQTAHVINKDLSGSFTFKGTSANVLLFMDLFVQDQYEYTDFSNTASLTIDTLPTGVSFTSASGDFLASATVPEPSSIMMLACMLISMITLRKRISRA